MEKRYKVEKGEIYRIINHEADIQIDQYLEEKGYQEWENLSQEDREKILYEQWQDEQEYIRYCRNDWWE